ncbi:chromodomain-helicase-DNA-binding protein 2-like [Pogonomyrmex barbatus]|uniref:Chromodomain-helicase-DNA-binding protein 2-like n=1 Tax=Pogonomyrmex barbatus TaxID=144034 RepID=A0A6I9WVY0_9HYME|nr:chromodomain-helicase-DNA-binding protein 2-like [Pogonomyrmex barbatus]
MRRLSMKNKRRKSETEGDSESEENVGARATNDNAGNGETQTGRNSNAQKNATKRRSARGAPAPKPTTDGDVEAEDEASEDVDGAEMKAESQERENGEKTPTTKLSPNKRRKKEDQKASTSAQDKSDKSDKPEDNEYEVEDLINLRTVKGRRQFLVRWKGYGESADSWENEKDLNCPELIEDYLAKEKEKEKEIKSSKTDKSPKSKKSRSSPKKQTENDEENTDKDSSKEFEVEKIIEVHFKKNGTKEFLIRWKGFSPADDTWEPEKNLNCPELITKFMQKLEKVKTSEVRELRMNRAHTKRYTLTTRDRGRRLSKRNIDKQRPTYHECDE